MIETEPPAAIVQLAEERSEARLARDWSRADVLRAAIEAAGWRIEDVGTAFRLQPAQPPDVEVESQRYYGSVESIPSRLEAAASERATFAIIVGIGVSAASATSTPLALPTAHASAGVQVVVVAPLGAAVESPGTELVGTATPFSAGDALQAALRRATGKVIVVLADGSLPDEDILAPMEAALADPEVAIVGDAGVASTDLRRFSAAPFGDVAAVRSVRYAFRRADAIALGRVDARLNLAESAAVWLSLALRDRGPSRPPRRALALALPRARQGTAPRMSSDGEEPSDAESRLARRDRYRIAERFAGSPWLAAHEEVSRMPGKGPQGDDEEDHGSEGEDTTEA